MTEVTNTGVLATMELGKCKCGGILAQAKTQTGKM